MVSTTTAFPRLRCRFPFIALAATVALSLAACDRMGGNKPPPVGSAPGAQNPVSLGTGAGAGTGAPGAATVGPGTGSGGLGSGGSSAGSGSSSSSSGSMP